MMKKKQKTTSSYTAKKNRRKLFLCFLSIIALDQITKFLVKRYLAPEKSLILVKNFLSITYTTNTGASFGLFKGFNILFILISIVVLGFLIFKYKNKYWLPISILCAGISGNLIDRVLLGYVVDFVDFGFWPVFNVADSAISIGIVWLIILSFKTGEDIL
jgi:signal peptidase II